MARRRAATTTGVDTGAIAAAAAALGNNDVTTHTVVAAAHPAGARWKGGSKLKGLSPRPASTHDWGSRLVDASHDPEEIGRAITCGLKRRSRSLSMIRNVDFIQTGGITRRRSDDIRYWRESQDPAMASPISSTGPGAEDVEILSIDKSMMKPESVPEEPHSPVQPFQFGDMTCMTEMASMNLKITEAASLETRIGGIENRLGRVESVVTQLCDAVPDFQPHVDHPARPAPFAPPNPSEYQTHAQDAEGSTRPSTCSSDHHSAASKSSFADSPTYVGSIREQSPPKPHFDASNRSTSTGTIRGAATTASFPTVPKDMSTALTIEHYTTIMALLETERAARQALEAQVKNLSYRIDFMANVPENNKPLRNGSPLTGRLLSETSAFDIDDDEEEDVSAPNEPGRTRHSLSQEDSGIATEGFDDDENSESYATPYEDKVFDTINGDQDFSKAEARALSLSLLTMGNGMAPLAMQPISPGAI